MGSFKGVRDGRAEITAKEKSGQTGVGKKCRDVMCSVRKHTAYLINGKITIKLADNLNKCTTFVAQ